MEREQVEQNKKDVLAALEAFKGIVSDACLQVGIGRTTFYRYVKEDPEFKAAVDAVQDVALDYVESKLFERIEGVMMTGKRGEEAYSIPPDTTAIIFYLKTKGKKRGYVERTEHTGVDGQPLEFTLNLNGKPSVL